VKPLWVHEARSLRPGEKEAEMKAAPGFCDMCGHHVAIRQRAHIVAEGRKAGANLLLLCPSCHIVLDTRLKPAILEALLEAGVRNLPKSWYRSIYEQAAIASANARRDAGVVSRPRRKPSALSGLARRKRPDSDG
jgi:hypothetical protein